MASRKEIKFKPAYRGAKALEGRQDGVIFKIHRSLRPEHVDDPAYSVMATDTKGQGRNISTSRHQYFTLDGAKEFCQQIAAGEIDLEALRAKFDAEDMAKERRAVHKATEEAKEFRAKLEAAGISYETLLDLSAENEALDSMARNILMGLERGEDLPNG